MKEQIAIQHLLKKNLLELQGRNNNYSLRSFSKKVGVHAGALSAIMNGKRNVSRNLAERIAKGLFLDPQVRSEILALFPEKRKYSKKSESTAESQDHRAKYIEIEAMKFKLIAEWEHYAILSLMNCEDFNDDFAWIAKRIGISEDRALKVIKTLLAVGLIKRGLNDKLERTYASVRSSDDTINLSLRKSHEKTLELAQESLHRDTISERDFTYVTMAIDPEKISMAKEMIRRFQDELAEVLESGKKSEVYRLAMQLFPLTRLTNSEQTVKEKENLK